MRRTNKEELNDNKWSINKAPNDDIYHSDGNWKASNYPNDQENLLIIYWD